MRTKYELVWQKERVEVGLTFWRMRRTSQYLDGSIWLTSAIAMPRY